MENRVFILQFVTLFISWSKSLDFCVCFLCRSCSYLIVLLGLVCGFELPDDHSYGFSNAQITMAWFSVAQLTVKFASVDQLPYSQN